MVAISSYIHLQVSKLQKDERSETKLLNKRLRDEGDEETFPSKVFKF